MAAPVVEIRNRLRAFQAQYGKSEMERMEAFFWRWAGIGRRDRSPHPLQRPTTYFPGLTGKPWLETDNHPGIRQLEEKFDVLREELNNARQAHQHFDDGTPHDGNWRALYIRYGSKMVEKNREFVPKTMEIIENLPKIGEMAMVSRLEPHAHIKPHCGPNNIRLTAHLGLHVPKGCEFRVGEETRPWIEGKCLFFDDSFEHEAMNPTDDFREVLLVDFWHPDLTDIEIEFMEAVTALLASKRSRLDEG